MAKSWHRADEEITHANFVPLVSGGNISPAQLTMFVESIDSAVDARTAVAGGVTFTEVLLAAAADVTVEGYITPAGASDPHCGNSVACTDNPNSNYPHLGRQTLYFEQPPIWTMQDVNMNDVNAVHTWTNNVNLVGTLNMDYMPAVMMHEFGHTAGLGHSAGPQDVMGPPSNKSVLSANDKRAMREIYENHIAH